MASFEIGAYLSVYTTIPILSYVLTTNFPGGNVIIRKTYNNITEHQVL